MFFYMVWNHVLSGFDRFSRSWQTRKHCCGNIVDHNVSWASKRAGSKINDSIASLLGKARNICSEHVILRARNAKQAQESSQHCFLRKKTGMHLLRAQNSEESATNVACAGKQTGKHLFPQQCFHVCHGLKTSLCITEYKIKYDHWLKFYATW